MAQKIIGRFFPYKNKKLEQKILGVRFKNPVGLAAGFDKDGRATSILQNIGFGFSEVGSITGEPCIGNPKPRLWRLKKSKGIVVNLGLNNDGAEKIRRRLENRKFDIPLITSIAKTNNPATVPINAGIQDYLKAYRTFYDIGEFFDINISCPNAYGGEPFTNPEYLDKLLTEIDKIKTKKPNFLKLSPDLEKDKIDRIIEISRRHKISGFICTNLAKNKSNLKIKEKKPLPTGGISGKPLENLANEVIKYIYKKTKGEFVIIGCGGIFSAEDAYKKIKMGASLVQLITGMIFEGPQLISQINQGLAELLEKDGFNNISRAVGKDVVFS